MLSSNLADQLATCVTGVLHVVTEDLHPDNNSKTRQEYATYLGRASAAIQRVVQQAIANFYEDWNAAHRDPLLSLPPELTSACFGHLDFSARIAASHVSRGWRSRIISDSSLWNDLELTRSTPAAVVADVVMTTLERSRPLPFHLSLAQDDYAVDTSANMKIFDLLIQNTDRIASLQLISVLLPDMLPRLFAHDMPLLKGLSFTPTTPDTSVYELPSCWGYPRVQNLRSLAVGRFSVPAHFAPLTGLRSFSGAIPLEDGHLDARLFALFPQLEQIELQHVTETALPDLLHMPSSIASIRLNTSCFGAPVDYSVFLLGFAHRAWRHVSLGNSSAISGSLQFFSRATAGTWSLTISTVAPLLAVGLEDGISCEIANYSSDYTFLGSLARLAALTLPLGDLETFARSTAWDHALPALQSLTITLVYAHDLHTSSSSLLEDHGEDVSAIHAPKLDLVTFDTTHLEAARYSMSPACAHWLTTRAPDVLRILCTWSEPRLRKVAIANCRSSPLLGMDLTKLRALARQLSIRETTTGKVTEFFADDYDDSTGAFDAAGV